MHIERHTSIAYSINGVIAFTLRNAYLGRCAAGRYNLGSKTVLRVVILFVVAFAAEKLLSGIDEIGWYISVFVAVYVTGRVLFSHRGRVATAYLEDVLLGLFLCVGIASLAWYFDGQISVYSGKTGGPGVPAAVFSLIEEFVDNTHS